MPWCTNREILGGFGVTNQRARRNRLSFLWLTEAIVVLRHVHVWVRIPYIQRAIAIEYILLLTPPSEMTKNDSLDMAPLQRRRWSNIRKSQSGEGGDDGEAVDHGTTEWDAAAWRGEDIFEVSGGTEQRFMAPRTFVIKIIHLIEDESFRPVAIVFTSRRVVLLCELLKRFHQLRQHRPRPIPASPLTLE